MGVEVAVGVWVGKRVQLAHHLGKFDEQHYFLLEADAFIATVDALRLVDQVVQ